MSNATLKELLTKSTFRSIFLSKTCYSSIPLKYSTWGKRLGETLKNVFKMCLQKHSEQVIRCCFHYCMLSGLTVKLFAIFRYFSTSKLLKFQTEAVIPYLRNVVDALLKSSIDLHRLEHCQRALDCPRKNSHLYLMRFAPPELPTLSLTTFDRAAFLWPSTGIAYLLNNIALALHAYKIYGRCSDSVLFTFRSN